MGPRPKDAFLDVVFGRAFDERGVLDVVSGSVLDRGVLDIVLGRVLEKVFPTS